MSGLDVCRDDFVIFFNYIYKGDARAKELSLKLMDVIHVWDDLYDGDKEVSQDEINQAFVDAMIELPSHPYWNRCGIGHHMVNVFLRWNDANSLEAQKTDLEKAYMLRAGIYDIFSILAYHLYGMAWAKEVGVMIRQFYSETLEGFTQEVENA